MSFKKTLTSLVVAGAVAVGGLANKVNAKTTEGYFEDFNEPNSVNDWVISDPNKVYQTTFEGNGVLRFDIDNFNSPPNFPTAYLPINPLNNNSFKLEWDSYMEFLGENIDSTLKFGLFNDTTFEEAGYIRLNHENIFGYFGIGISGWSKTQGDFLWGRGFNRSDFYNKWFHNVILYNFPYKNDRHGGLIIYEGKGVVNDPNFELLLHESIDYTKCFLNLNKLGILSNSCGDYLKHTETKSKGYIDNILYTKLKENPTLKGDLNSDGIVDFKDFAEFASEWLQQEDWYP